MMQNKKIEKSLKLASKIKLLDNNGNSSFDLNGNGCTDSNGNGQFDINGNN